MIQQQFSQVRLDTTVCRGGLNLTEPPLRMPPGYVVQSINFDCDINGGYRRIPGYERFDGRASPSSSEYYTLPLSSLTAYPTTTYETVTGGTSGATAKFVRSGTNTLYVTSISGTFVAGETITAASVGAVGVCGAAPYLGGAESRADASALAALTATYYRSLITAVPGSGSILGVWFYKNVVYAFRNNAGGTAAEMYKSTTSGWSKVNFEYEVAFTAGGGSVDDGDTLTQGGVTATIRRVVTTTGSLDSSTAAGILVISAPAGGSFAAGAATTTGGGSVTLSGAHAAITLAPNGRFEFYNNNFSGGASTYRMYGCDGVNRRFEFDGSYFVPMPTGNSPDNPRHISVNAQHAFFSIGASVQHSAPGQPFLMDAALGAGEIGVGEDVTAFIPELGSSNTSSLIILSRNMSYILYGTESSNWQLILQQQESGAVEWTAQRIGAAIVLDDRGVTRQGQSQSFGNFEASTLSKLIRPFILERITTATASMIRRDRNQYRIFFSDSYGVYFTLTDRGVEGAMPVLFGVPVKCCCSGEGTSGQERAFFGSSDGFVYELDVGPSFDGASIPFRLGFPYNNQRVPQVKKKYHKLSLEIFGTEDASFNVGYSLGYGEPDEPQGRLQPTAADVNESLWDSFVWDNFFFDGRALAPSRVKLDGTAENISIAIEGNSSTQEEFTITGFVLHYSTRNRIR